MRFLLRILLIIVLSYIGQLFLPFWIIVVMAFLVSFFMARPRKKHPGYGRKRSKQRPPFSFIAGFLAIALLWGGLAYGIDQANASVLSGKIAQLLRVNNLPAPISAPMMMVGLTAIVGGLLGGLGSLSGNLLGEIVKS